MSSPKIAHYVSLSELQLAVMRVLWEHGETANAEVQSRLEPNRTLAHTTVATLLSRLEKRGVVASRREGRQLIYRALISEGDVRRSMVSDLISTLFKGDPKALMAHLVRESEMRPGDLERVRALLDRKQDDD
ncbi:MAG: BlaI/MecI/CopY family transcriptional regulator [Gammaproteobacteria bacterium]